MSASHGYILIALGVILPTWGRVLATELVHEVRRRREHYNY